MIRSDAGRCPVSAQCGILGVAKATCYWVLEHPEAERADPYEKDVERVWRDSGKVYGARKIRHALGHEGVTLSRRRINRIMKGNGMAGSCSKAAYRPRPARPNDDPAPDILAREFNGYAPRTQLASDPAYVRVGASWSYVCLPGGLANRQIAGHSVEVGHDTDLVLAAFAAPRFPLTDIQVLRTDRGGGFAGERMERMLAEFGITRSLSRPGSPYDNAVVESTDRLIRKELMYDNVCTSVERLRSDLNRYVWWYDHQRLHSTLDYMSPVEFTQQGKTLQEQSNTPLPIHALVVPSNLHMMKNLGNTLLCRPLCRRLYSGRQR